MRLIRRTKNVKQFFLLAGLASVSFLTQTMSASVAGTLTEANCAGGGVTVTSTTIVWTPAGSLVPNTGCIDSGIGTALTWSGGGSMGAGAVGYIQDEPGAPPLPFMVFPAAGGNPTQTLDFLLTNGFAFTPPVGYLGAGQAACAAASAVAGDSCTALAGSPFLLITNANNTTTVDLFAAGTVADPNTPAAVSSWNGTLNTQFNGTPTGVYNQICPTAACLGSASNTQSATFNVTIVPEPGTIAMILIGGLLLASSKKKRKA